MKMSEPKLHHYVPQFYLKHFGCESGRFYVWDKCTSNVFLASSGTIGAQNHFYRIPQFVGTNVDPLFLEKNLADMECVAANIHREILAFLPELRQGEFLQLTHDERDSFATFISMQFLRTAESRELLALCTNDDISEDEKINLHAQMLCEIGGLVEKVGERIFRSNWLYARNQTTTPFWTSDNPVCFKSGDNRIWLKWPGILSSGTYAVYPLSPEFILYCLEPSFWKSLQRLDSSLSPIQFTQELVEHENAGQVFMATRHVISPKQDFEFANEFLKSIETDHYAG